MKPLFCGLARLVAQVDALGMVRGALLCLLFLAACNEPQPPQIFHAKTSFIRSFTNPALNQIDSLAFRTNEARTARKERIAIRISDIAAGARRLSGGGILPYEAYVSATFLQDPGFFYAHTNGAAGDVPWLKSHLHKLAIVSKANYLQHSEDYDYEPSDSTLNLAPLDDPAGELHPVYPISGAAYFARLDRVDDFIPWHHPDVDPDNLDPSCFLESSPTRKCIDMQSLTRLLFRAVSGAVVGAVNSIGPITIPGPGGVPIPIGNAVLGGPNGNGDFKLWFIPQVQFNESGGPAEIKLRRPGMGFIFEATIRINAPVIPLGYASLKVYIPILIIAERLSGTDLLLSFTVQPFEDLAAGVSPAFGIEKLVILSNTPAGILGQGAAASTRTAIVASLTALPATNPAFAGMLLGADAALELGLNKYINLQRKVAHPLEFDLITLPTQCANRTDLPLCFEYNGVTSTQVQPEDGEHTPIATFILER